MTGAGRHAQPGRRGRLLARVVAEIVVDALGEGYSALVLLGLGLALKLAWHRAPVATLLVSAALTGLAARYVWRHAREPFRLAATVVVVVLLVLGEYALYALAPAF